MNYRLISILTILFFLSGCSVFGGGQDTKKLVADGLTPKELYENPASPKCAQYFGLENIFYGNIKNNMFSCNNFSLFINHKDIQNIVLIIPFNAITIDTSKIDDEDVEIESMIFTEGRWKNRLKNGIVFFSKKFLFNVTFLISSLNCMHILLFLNAWSKAKFLLSIRFPVL